MKYSRGKASVPNAGESNKERETEDAGILLSYHPQPMEVMREKSFEA